MTVRDSLRAAIEDAYPLTPMQAAMLSASLSDPDAGMYVQQPVYELEGDLSPGALRAALALVVARHPALRTGFVWERVDRPLQVVYRSAEPEWREADPAGDLDALLAADRRRGFDLRRPPLLRAALAGAGPGRHRLVLTHHHLAMDGWSLGIVVDELLRAHEALAAGREPDLPPAPGYRPYVEWLRGQPAEASAPVWRRALAGFPVPTPLGIDVLRRVPSAPREVEPRRARRDLRDGPAQAVRRFAAGHGLAASTPLLGAWALALARCSGWERVVFGATVAGRPAGLEGVGGVVGTFVGSVPVPVEVPGRTRVLPWLWRLQRDFAVLREHGHRAPGEVRAWAGVPADRPLFESLLTVQNLGGAVTAAAAGRLRARLLGGQERTGLPLAVVPVPAPPWRVIVDFDGRRIPVPAGERLAEQYLALLLALCAGPDARLGDLRLPAPPPPEAVWDGVPLDGLRAELGDPASIAAGGPPDDGLALLAARLAGAAGARLVPPGPGAELALAPPAAWRGRVRPAARAVVAGEPPDPKLAADLGRGALRLYGPPEAGGACAVGPADPAAPLRPLPGCVLHVLDRELRPQPPHVAGELYLGGAAVARARADGPAETAGRFLPDPLAGRPGARMLRTGDRARRLEDGSVVVVGRFPGSPPPAVSDEEIEVEAGRHPDVRQAFVARAAGGEAVCLFVPERPPGPAPAALRAWLRRTVPAHLVPAWFAPVDRPPLTRSGLTDRARLAAPAAPREEDPRPEPVEARLAALPADRRAGFMERLEAAADGPAGVRPRTARGPLPLSVQQEQSWFLEHLAPGRARNNVPFALRLRGGLDTAVLREALADVVARHEVLRTDVVTEGDAPVQVVAPERAVELPVVDLSGLDPERRAARAAELGLAWAREAFAVGRGPLLRARLLRLGPAEHRLVVVAHHLILDPRSAEILAGDLLACHRHRLGGAPAPPPPAVQYADFALWQRARLRGRPGRRLRAWWRDRLRDLPPPELPAGREPAGPPAFEGAGAAVSLEAGATASLRRLAERAGADLGAVLLAAWAVLLHRYTGQEDFGIGVPLDLRLVPELARVAGDFGNLVVVRAGLEGDPSYSDLVARLGAARDEALAHGELPFRDLVEYLRPARAGARMPLFHAFFDHRSEPEPDRDAGPLAAELEFLSDGGAPFELALRAAEVAGGGLRIELVHNRDLFDEAAADRLLGSLVHLLREVAERPDRRLGVLDMVPGEQRRELLAWARGPRAPAPDRTPAQLFAAQVAARPDALAVECGEARLTYAELDRLAGRLASRLRGLRVVPEAPVGVCLPRGVEMVAAVLGVVRAGGAYVPLDPSHPPARQRDLLADAGAAAVVTTGALAERFAGLDAAVVTAPGARGPDDRGERRVTSPPDAGPGGLAYVIYTSGSTGRPKGVLVEGRSVAGFVAHIAAAYGIGPESRVLGLAPLTFDVSVFELFGALLTGASLHLADEEDRRSPERLQRLLAERRITVAELPPVLMPMLRPEELPDLVLVSVGGEPPPGELVERWATGRRRFFNGYGPTETTVAVTLRDCRGRWTRPPPIGRPMPGHACLVLDAELQLVPAGARGELYVAGTGVARGYAGRPGPTAERFLPNPFPAAPGERLYRTGDLARWLPAGELEFLGRADRQVKLHGQRVEPGEVEAALRPLPGVEGAAVEVRPDAAGVPHLVAYVTGARAPGLAEVREALGAVLPQHLVPTRCVRLGRLPVTASGKVDRAALPPPDAPGGAAPVPAAPMTAMQRRVLEEVLRPVLPQAPEDAARDFFELGGDSLEAIQVVSRARAAFGVEVPVGEFLAEPTVATLAALVERELSAAPAGPRGSAAGGPSPRPGRPDAAPLSPAQARVFAREWPLGQPGSAIPVAMRVGGELDVAALERALAGLGARHPALRTVFEVGAGGRPVQRVRPEPPPVAPLRDLAHVPPDDALAAAAALADEDAAAPFDLAAGPLFRSGVLRLGPADHVLLLNVHHVVADAWSLQVLVRDLWALYAAAAHGGPDGLPELPLGYGDVAAWQVARLADGSLGPAIARWRRRLAGAPAGPRLGEAPAAPPPAPAVERIEVGLDREATARLRSLAREEGATPFMAVQAGFASALAALTGSHDLVLGTPAAGRTRAELEDLVGLFANPVPVRLDLSGRPSFRDLVRRAREASADAFADQEVPVQALVEALGVEAEPGRAPLFQVLVVLQNAGRRPGGAEPRVRLGPLPRTGSPLTPVLPFYGWPGRPLDAALQVVEVGGRLTGSLEYDPARVRAEVAAGLAERIVAALKSPG